jgi:hypothetical protein
VTCWLLVRLFVGGVYVVVCPAELLREPGPVSVHETLLRDGSFVTVAVKLAVSPWSIACGEEGDRLTEIGVDPPPHAASVAVATTNRTVQQKRTRSMAPPSDFSLVSNEYDRFITLLREYVAMAPASDMSLSLLPLIRPRKRRQAAALQTDRADSVECLASWNAWSLCSGGL